MSIQFPATSGNYLNSGSSPFSLDVSDGLTWMAWCRWDDLPTGYEILFHYLPNTGNKLAFEIQGSVSDQLYVYCDNAAWAVGGDSITAEDWLHLAFTIDSSNVMRGYLNGVEQVSKDCDDAGGYTAGSGVASFLTGVWEGGASMYFDGQMAVQKIWDTNLSVAEILQEMYFIRPVTDLVDFVSWVPMFPGSSERIYDYQAKISWNEVGTLADGADSPPVAWGAPILASGVLGVEDLGVAITDAVPFQYTGVRVIS